MRTILFISVLSLVITPTFGQSNGIELSHYIFPEFTSGTVLMKNRHEYKALLNYNALTEEMIFDDKGVKLAIGTEEKERVDTVYVMDRKFFTLKGTFVELIYRSESELYAEYKCDVKYPGKPAAYGGTSETTAVSSYSGILSGGVMYELQLPDDYKIRPYAIYWLKRDGELKKFVSMKQLTKLFDDRKDRFKEYISTHNVEFDNQESIVQLIKYMESN